MSNLSDRPQNRGYDQHPGSGGFTKTRPDKVARGRRIAVAIRAGRSIPPPTDRALDLLTRDLARADTTIEPDIWKATAHGTQDGARRPLTRRQAEILQLYADGVTPEQIMAKLGCSRSNVTNLCDGAKFALDAASIHQAIAVAVSAGLVVGKPLPLYAKARKPALSARKQVGELSPREREVMRLLAEGESSAEIAVSLGITVHTVKSMLKRATEKLGARSRAHAVVLALRTGEISL